MSTRSTITLKKEDGTFARIYCHFDGYVEGGVGSVLAAYYSTYELVDELIKMGDASYIKENIETSYFYGRDRHEKNTQCLFFKDLNDFEDKNRFEDFNYIFIDNQWLVSTWDSFNYKPVVEQLKNNHTAVNAD